MHENSPNRLGAVLSIAMFLSIGVVSPAAAQGFTDFFGNILGEFENVRRPLAIIALMVVGFCYAFNVIDMRTTGRVVVGIIIMFAAAAILDLITA